jgi:hypothetical protein
MDYGSESMTSKDLLWRGGERNAQMDAARAAGGGMDLAGFDPNKTVDYSQAATGTQATAPPPPSGQSLPGGPGDVKQPPTAPDPNDPFVAQGGGVNINGNWFPKDHPGAIEWMKNNPQAGAPKPGPTEPQPPAAPPTTTPQPATPSPTINDDQKIYRDALLAGMKVDENVTVNDPAIKAQLDPMKAAAERAMRQDVRGGAEAAFADGQDFGAPEKVAAMERMGNQQGMMAAELVGRETQAKRDRIDNYLKEFGASLDTDKKLALQKEMQKLDLDLKKYLGDRDFELGKGDQDIRLKGLDQTGRLGDRELTIREKLGMGGLNNDLQRMLIGDRQFRDRLGFDIGATEADLNRRAMLDSM